jgi:thiamine kinase-like enzyme
LKKGWYINAPTCDYIYRIGSHKHFDKVTFTNLSSKKTNATRKLLLKLLIYSNKREGNFGGTEIIISSSNTEYKVFNEREKKLLTYFIIPQKMRLIIKNKNYFSSFFNVPRTIFIDKTRQIIEEEYIEHQDIDNSKALNSILWQYVEFFRNVTCSKVVNNSLDFHSFSNRFGNSKLYSAISEYPLVVTHGDLWSSNVIYDGDKYYITDFERVGTRFFLFDFFCFICNEYIIKGDDSLIYSYFNGTFDTQLSEILKLVWKNQLNENREALFIAFWISMRNERWGDNDAIDAKIEHVIRKYVLRF